MLPYAAQSEGGDDDGAKRAWARAATQRVLDLMLVTERVRQEEQKRRVAAARASNQVTKHNKWQEYRCFTFKKRNAAWCPGHAPLALVHDGGAQGL